MFVNLKSDIMNGLASHFNIIFQVAAFQEFSPRFCVHILFHKRRYIFLLQINGVEKKSIRLPRQELDNLTHDDALELALSQPDLQRYTSGYKIVNTAFTLHPSYEAVINIKTERISKVKHQQMQDT